MLSFANIIIFPISFCWLIISVSMLCLIAIFLLSNLICVYYLYNKSFPERNGMHLAGDSLEQCKVAIEMILEKYKDVINIKDGTRLGSVCDVEIDTQTSQVKSLIIYGKYKLFGLFFHKYLLLLI